MAVYDEYRRREMQMMQAQMAMGGGGGQQNYQDMMMQQQMQAYAAQNFQANGGFSNGSGIQAHDAFASQFFDSPGACDKSISQSTYSSFDIQSMDMSSIGANGFDAWNQSQMSNNNSLYASGLISTGSTANRSRGTHRSGAGGNGKSKSSKSALERKLEKVNEAHRRQQAAQALERQQRMMIQQQQMQMMNAVAEGLPQQQQVPTQNQHHRNRSAAQDNMASLNSFGFEAIEEDEITEASYKMSNLGFSEMDMTFNSSVLSIRSKSAPKLSRASENDGQSVGEGTGEDSTPAVNADEMKRSNSDGHEKRGMEEPNVNGITASSIFNQSLSSSNTSSSFSKSQSSMKMKMNASVNMDDFNESFKSMEMSCNNIAEERPNKAQKK